MPSQNWIPIPSTKVAPMLLARVCSHWRAVAMSTPQLWASINLSDSGLLLFDYSKDATAAEEWRIRSGSCLLSYRLCYDREEGDWTSVLEAILPHHKQWRHMEGRLPVLACIQVHSAISRGAPDLQYLAIIGGSESYAVMKVPHPGCPNLHSLLLKQCDFRFDFVDTGAPLLRKVVLDKSWRLNLDDCWRFLHYCRNLEIFAAYCASREPLTAPTSLTTRSNFHQVRRLKKLHLEMEFDISGQLIDCLHAPALETLELANYHTGGGHRPLNGFPRLAPFLTRSSAHLTSMDIELDITDDEFLASVLHTPGLTSLQIRNRWTFDPDRVLDALIMRPAKPHILPLLECITFTRFPGSKSGLIENIVLSRWGGKNGTGTSLVRMPSGITSFYRWLADDQGLCPRWF